MSETRPGAVNWNEISPSDFDIFSPLCLVHSRLPTSALICLHCVRSFVFGGAESAANSPSKCWKVKSQSQVDESFRRRRHVDCFSTECFEWWNPSEEILTCYTLTSLFLLLTASSGTVNGSANSQNRIEIGKGQNLDNNSKQQQWTWSRSSASDLPWQKSRWKWARVVCLLSLLSLRVNKSLLNLSRLAFLVSHLAKAAHRAWSREENCS